MKETYQEAITQVFKDEGGYTNDVGDPGGPTNWGITLADAKLYWRPHATSNDVRIMPKSVAEDIYRKHYATPLCYDDLNPGVDYAVLDYGINSGIHRAARVVQRIINTTVDGWIGPNTVTKANKIDPKILINKIYDERMAFLKSLKTWSIFGNGWTRRCVEGRAFALKLADKHKVAPTPTSVPIVVGGAGAAGAVIAATAPNEWFLTGLLITVGAAIVIGFIVYLYERGKNVTVPVAN